MERQATQPAAVPSGRKRRRVCGKKKKDEEEKAQEWVKQVSEPLTPPAEETVQEKPARTLRFYELLDVYKQDVHNQVDMPVTEEWLERQYGHLSPPSTPVYHSIEALLEGVDKLHQEPTPQTLKDYEEEVVDEGPLREEVDLDTMETNLNDLLYQTCPFHPHQYIHCLNPDAEFGQLRYKCPQQGCPVYFFEDTRQVILDKLNDETHPQVRAKLKQGSLTCQCGFTPKMKLSRTTKNFQKVFFSCGQFNRTQPPCGYFQWLHGPLWQPRQQAQPTLRRWVKETPMGNIPCPPRLWRTQTQHPVVDKAPPKTKDPWLAQFARSAQAQEREMERRSLMHKKYGSMVLF